MSVLTIPNSNLVYARSSFGELGVSYTNENGFCIKDAEGTESHVQRADLSENLRGISAEKLEQLLTLTSLTIHKVGKDFAIRTHGGLQGGVLLESLTAYAISAATPYVTAAVATYLPAAAASAAPVIAGAALSAAAATLSGTLDAHPRRPSEVVPPGGRWSKTNNNDPHSGCMNPPKV